MTIYQPLQVKRSNIPNHKPASLAEGEIAANVKDGILFLGLEDNTVVKFYNSTNFYDEDAQFDSNVSNGDVVYKGSDGKYYQALADGSEKSNVVGIADVTNNRVISQGFISTSYSFNINDKVYLSQDTPGAMTNTPTIVNLGIYLGNGVILIAGRGGGSGEGLPYKSKLTLSSTYTVPNDYGVVVPEKFEVEDGGELVIEENGVFMIVDNDQPEKVYAFDSERLGNIPAADYFNYEGATKYSTLNDAVEAVGSANKDLLIKGNVTVDSDLTIPENVNLVFARNGKITVNSGVTLTINGGIQAGLWQIFDGNGTITGNPKIEAVYPEWFGAKGDGVTDDTEAIDKLTNLFTKIFLTSIYAISSINLKQNTIIEGGGELKCISSVTSVLNIADNIILKDIKIDGNNLATYGVFGSADNITIKNVKVTGCGNSNLTDGGIKINGKNIKIKNVESYSNNGSGVVVFSSSTKGAEDIFVESCYLHDNECHGFVTDVEDRSLLNVSYDSDYRIKKLVIINCKALNNGRTNSTTGLGQCSGFALHYCRGSIISSCIATYNREHGIVLMDGLNNNCEDNFTAFNGLAGIRIQGHTGVPEDSSTGEKYSVISGNNIYNNGVDSNATSGVASGMWISANVQRISIHNNMLQSNIGYGISIATTQDYSDPQLIFVDDNIFVGNNEGNILLNYDTELVYGENYEYDSGNRLRKISFNLDKDFTSSSDLTYWVSQKTYTNKGATSAISLTLPPADKEYELTFIVCESYELSINARTGVGDNIAPSYSSASSSNIGDSIVLYTKGNNKWYVKSMYGSWTFA